MKEIEFMEKKETLNNIILAGVLVDKNIEAKEGTDKKTGSSYNYISGEVIIRTKDGSEIPVDVYSKELTKSGTANSIYKGLTTVMEEYKSLKTDPEDPDYIKIGGANFSVNDYKSKKDGTIKTFNGVSAKFLNRLTDKELEITAQESKFEVEGVISEIKDITNKDGVPTGDKSITLNVLGYEGNITPVTMTLPQPLVAPFTGMGYMEGCVATLWGKIINTREEKEIVEQAGFGVSNTKIVTTTVKRNEITGGKPPVALAEIGYTDEDYNQAKAKRKLKIDGLLNGQSTNGQTQAPTNPFGTAPTTPVANPFA
jgi:hypothetical protein